MCRLGFPTIVLCGVLMSVEATLQSRREGVEGGQNDAHAVLAAARTALGGDAKIAAVKTFIATGRTRLVRGENLVPIEFEIQS